MVNKKNIKAKPRETLSARLWRFIALGAAAKTRDATKQMAAQTVNASDSGISKSLEKDVKNEIDRRHRIEDCVEILTRLFRYRVASADDRDLEIKGEVIVRIDLGPEPEVRLDGPRECDLQNLGLVGERDGLIIHHTQRVFVNPQR